MKSFKTLITILLSVSLITSCEKVIEFNGPITNPIVIVNSFVTPDSVLKAQVSLSRFFLSNEPTYTLIDTATVSLTVNGQWKETLTSAKNGVYVGTYKPIIGDSIQLNVKIKGKNDINCATNIQPQPQIVSVVRDSVLTGKNTLIINQNTKDTLGTTIGRTLKCVLNFQDDPSKQNYYRLVVYTKTYSGSKPTIDYTFSFDDIVSGNTNQDNFGPPTSLATNRYNVFSDDLINGKKYGLKFSVSYNKNVYLPGKVKVQPVKELYIVLQNISHSYYLYLQTRSAIKVNSFFAEPAQVYSNIDGGIGILGSYTGNTVKIVL